MGEEYLQKAIDFDKKAHAGQKRRDGKDYFTHVSAVAQITDSKIYDHKYLFNFSQEIRLEILAGAYLHDVVEDTTTTLEDLQSLGFTDYTIQIVKDLTRRNGETYYDFIMRQTNIPSILVKLADLEHNMSDGAKEGSLLDKYRFAHYILLQEIQ